MKVKEVIDRCQTQHTADNKDTKGCNPNCDACITLDKRYFFRPQDMQGKCLCNQANDEPTTLESALTCDGIIVESELQ